METAKLNLNTSLGIRMLLIQETGDWQSGQDLCSAIKVTKKKKKPAFKKVILNIIQKFSEAEWVSRTVGNSQWDSSNVSIAWVPSRYLNWVIQLEGSLKTKQQGFCLGTAVLIDESYEGVTCRCLISHYSLQHIEEK